MDFLDIREPAKGRGLPHHMYSAMVGPRLIDRIVSKISKGGINFAPYSLLAFVLAALVLCECPAAMAQGYPSKPIIVKIAFPAGGPADVSIRAANLVLQRNLGQPLISENVPGATGSISAMAVLKSNADGYTLLGTTGSDLMVAPFTVSSAKYQPESFKLVGALGMSDFVLVSNPPIPSRISTN